MLEENCSKSQKAIDSLFLGKWQTAFIRLRSVFKNFWRVTVRFGGLPPFWRVAGLPLTPTL